MQFKNLKDLLLAFPTEQKCRDFIAKKMWGDSPICPFCNGTKIYSIENGKRFKCGNKTCYKKFSITVGTIFENTKIPLTTWFAAMYLVSAHKKGISSMQLSRDLGISQKTAWFLIHRIREMFLNKAPHLLRKVVEADETLVGGKNKNRHAHKKVPHSQGRSHQDKTSVFGLAQRGGYVTTFVVPDTKAGTLYPLIKQMLHNNSVLITDEWLGYNTVKQGFPHVVINHQQGEYARGAFDTNTIEGFWSLLKRGIYGTYHQVSPKHLQRYCDEFGFRYNTRKIKDNVRFEKSFDYAKGRRLKYKDLTKK